MIHRSASVLATMLFLAPLALLVVPVSVVSEDTRPCPEIPLNSKLEQQYPTYKYRCFPPGAYVVNGRAVGFGDNYKIDWVRPGMNVGPCSTSYLLTDDEGALFLSQSAHCLFEDEGEDFCDSEYKPIGTLVELEGFGSVGRVAYVSGLQMQALGATPAECESFDFALIEVPPHLHAVTHPAIRHIGGPTSLVDPLTLRFRNAMVGYGNSDDRGLVVELVARRDHGTLPVWPLLNTFQGYYVGSVLNEAWCAYPATFLCRQPYDGVHGYKQYVRYVVPKITGDSGSPDLTADGGAVGVLSVLNLATGLDGTMPLYDALLKIHHETGKRYSLVTWDEWSPTTLET